MSSADLACPADLYYAIEPQTWARPDADGHITVGITELGIRLSGEIYMCRPQDVGREIAAGRSIAVVELAKSIVSVKSPVSGTVLAVNPALATQPELVHLDPYGQGWLARLRPLDWPADAQRLLHGEPVRAAMRAHAALFRAEGD